VVIDCGANGMKSMVRGHPQATSALGGSNDTSMACLGQPIAAASTFICPQGPTKEDAKDVLVVDSQRATATTGNGRDPTDAGSVRFHDEGSRARNEGSTPDQVLALLVARSLKARQ
jgi:hypothetical protein